MCMLYVTRSSGIALDDRESVKEGVLGLRGGGSRLTGTLKSVAVKRCRK